MFDCVLNMPLIGRSYVCVVGGLRAREVFSRTLVQTFWW